MTKLYCALEGMGNSVFWQFSLTKAWQNTSMYELCKMCINSNRTEVTFMYETERYRNDQTLLTSFKDIEIFFLFFLFIVVLNLH